MTQAETRIVFASDPSEVGRLHERLTVLAVGSGLDEMAGFQLTCAVVEAVNNCIAHAYRGEGGQPITLRWIPGAESVAVEIRDRGIPMPVPLPGAATAPQPSAESGRGWLIIRQWTDQVDYAREGDENVLTLTRTL